MLSPRISTQGSPPQLYLASYIDEFAGLQYFQYSVFWPVNADASDVHFVPSSTLPIWSGNGSAGQVTDVSTIHSLIVVQPNAANVIASVRSAWIATDGIHSLDLPIDTSSPDNTIAIASGQFAPVLDACPTSTGTGHFTFVAPLNAALLFTVDSSGAARVHQYSVDGGI